jgi:phage shock protein A
VTEDKLVEVEKRLEMVIEQVELLEKELNQLRRRVEDLEYANEWVGGYG